MRSQCTPETSPPPRTDHTDYESHVDPDTPVTNGNRNARDVWGTTRDLMTHGGERRPDRGLELSGQEGRQKRKNQHAARGGEQSPPNVPRTLGKSHQLRSSGTFQGRGWNSLTRPSGLKFGTRLLRPAKGSSPLDPPACRNIDRGAKLILVALLSLVIDE